MSKIYMDRFNGTVFACLAEGNKLLEYHVETERNASIIGNIYKGKVASVLDGMQAAFVGVGLDKNAYLSADDIPQEAGDALTADSSPALPANLAVGDEIMVQAMKESFGTKGARVTATVSIAGRLLVYLPTFDFIGVSHKIENLDKREKLTRLIEKIKPQGAGFIVRTAAEDAPKKAIETEAKSLISSFETVKKNYEKAPPFSVVYQESDLVTRMIRDVYTPEVEEIVVGDEKIYARLKELSELLGKKLMEKVRLHTDKVDLFRHAGLSNEIAKLTKNKVYMPGGSYLILDKTEALTAIDVNTGKFTGRDNLEETVFRVNMTAAKEIARQVRLRNVSGIVVVDFIDMEEESHRTLVVEALKEALKSDRCKCNVSGMTGFGLVEFTRKKIRRSVSSVLEKKCPHCDGSGFIRSDVFIMMQIRGEVMDLFAAGYQSVIVEANCGIVDYIRKSAVSPMLPKGMEGKRLYFISHRTYHEEEFSVRGDNSPVLSLPDNALLLS